MRCGDLDVRAVRFDRTTYSIDTVFPPQFDPRDESGLVSDFEEPVLFAISSIEITATGARLVMPRFFEEMSDLEETIGVEYSQDLSKDSWIELGNFFTEGPDAVFLDPDFVRLGRRSGFYRAFHREPVE